jgi:hypothetical protein
VDGAEDVDVSSKSIISHTVGLALVSESKDLGKTMLDFGLGLADGLSSVLAVLRFHNKYSYL